MASLRETLGGSKRAVLLVELEEVRRLCYYAARHEAELRRADDFIHDLV